MIRIKDDPAEEPEINMDDPVVNAKVQLSVRISIGAAKKLKRMRYQGNYKSDAGVIEDAINTMYETVSRDKAVA